MTRKSLFCLAVIIFGLRIPVLAAAETLAPLKDGKSPQTVDEMWAGYDPTVELLEVEVYKEWEESGVVLRAVRYCIGTFKGKKSWMAAYYGFPEGGSNLPGLVQIHGGGGRAKTDECIINARRGYAVISLNWRADERYLQDEKLPEEAQTDWGAIDGSQSAESRGIEPKNDKKYDPAPSGRNEGYFLRTLAARRALTFLQQQPEVDGSKLGIYGHSMGGVITMETAAIDPRVKASAPSCAPPIDRGDSLEARTANAAAYAPNLNCPTLFMSPSNDFHGHVEDMEWIMGRMPAEIFNMARSEHYNHKHNVSCRAANFLWFDAHLKETFSYPDMPSLSVDLNTQDARPLVTLVPDQSMPIDWIDIFYTRDARYDSYPQVKSRLWKYAKPIKQADRYEVSLDIYGVEQPLWIFANVHYKLDKSPDVYQFKDSSGNFTVTSRMMMKSGQELQAAGMKATVRKSRVIESFDENWEKEWYFTRGGKFPMESWCLNDSSVPVPEYGKLVIEIKSQESNKLKVELNDYKAGAFSAIFSVKGSNVSEKIEVYPFVLSGKDGGYLSGWQDVPRPRIVLGPVGKWDGATPEFKRIFWEDVQPEEFKKKRSQLATD